MIPRRGDSSEVGIPVHPDHMVRPSLDFRSIDRVVKPQRILPTWIEMVKAKIFGDAANRPLFVPVHRDMLAGVEQVVATVELNTMEKQTRTATEGFYEAHGPSPL